ncbi:orotidine-5'-phosphate decarboxylase [Sporolactobacillus sp. Y61]|uniref:Orotidine 5'-phosphate decarboxylase n=1 Tax=Sporolactobacillus sp. Y61 TaxID=3160863 RepID=A0AAU8ID58_9BACL
MNRENGVIVALDVSTREDLFRLLRKINQPECYVKVGMELFYQEGADVIRELKDQGHKIFLDLKLHDIPHTVYRTMRGLASIGADMVNVHAAGGTEMMRAAVEGLEDGRSGRRPICLAVTQLTSTDQKILENELLINRPLPEVISHYSILASQSGLDGVVCSAWEARQIKLHTAPDFLAVTPGIRLEHDAAGDQKRVATPARAAQLGSDYIVVGRSITASADPHQACLRVQEEWRNSVWKTNN